jgi:LysR family hydrogen peroxide-inducible transcriptional activator
MDLSQVTLSQMRYAVAVEDAGGFRPASERCHVSQSGLSMQIQKLEDLLELRLFDRSKKPVLVTHEGRAALDQMRVVLRQTEVLGRVAAAHGEPSGPYRLGVIPTLAPTVVPLFLRGFLERFPSIELQVEERMTHEILAGLRSDTLDAGIAATPLNALGVRETQLGREPFFAYLPPSDPLLRKRSLSEADLRERQLWIMPEGHCFRTQVLSFCAAPPPTSHRGVHFESGSFETLIRLVDDGLGATVLPSLVVAALPQRKRKAQVRSLRAPTPVRDIGLLTTRSDLRRKVNEALVKLLRRALDAALGAAPRRSAVMPPLGDG